MVVDVFKIMKQQQLQCLIYIAPQLVLGTIPSKGCSYKRTLAADRKE